MVIKDYLNIIDILCIAINNRLANTVDDNRPNIIIAANIDKHDNDKNTIPITIYSLFIKYTAKHIQIIKTNNAYIIHGIKNSYLLSNSNIPYKTNTIIISPDNEILENIFEFFLFIIIQFPQFTLYFIFR